MSKHTPGPWIVNGCGRHTPVNEAWGRCVRVRDAKGNPIEKTPENLSLMSAAPDMLEALEAVADAIGGLDDVGTSEAIVCNEHTAPVINAAFALARNAIKKARGQS